MVVILLMLLQDCWLDFWPDPPVYKVQQVYRVLLVQGVLPVHIVYSYRLDKFYCLGIRLSFWLGLKEKSQNYSIVMPIFTVILFIDFSQLLKQ